MKRTKKIALIMLAVMLMAVCFVLEMNASSTDEELIEYKEGCYTYTVKNGEATLVDVDDDVSGHLIVPETLGGYPLTNMTNDPFRGFYDCNVSSVYLPAKLRSVGCAFYFVPDLMSISVDESNPYLTTKDGILYNKDITELLAVPYGNIYDTLVIPATVKKTIAYQSSGGVGYRINKLKFEENSQLEMFNGDSVFYFIGIGELIIPPSCDVENICLGFSCAVQNLSFEEGRKDERLTYNERFLGWSVRKIDLPKSFVGIDEKGLYSTSDSLKTLIIRNPRCEIYDNWNTINPNVTIHGYKNSTAQSFAEKYNRNFVVLECDHKLYDYIEIISEPTCTKVGVEKHTCACGDNYITKEIPSTGHNHQKVIVMPTCVKKGYTKFSCDCGDFYIIDEKAALGHQMSEWTSDESIKRRYCTVCGYNETKLATDNGDIEIEAPQIPDTDFEVDEIKGDKFLVVEGAITNGIEGNAEVLRAFDITLKNKDGVHVQPDGTVKVKLPLDWSKEGIYKVYRVNDDGTLTDMNAYRQGSHMVFETDHFSIYVIVDESEKAENPVEPEEPDEPIKNCSHMCHKGGISGFIWNIVRFFWKLFKMNPTCQCGVAHY